MMGNCVVSVTSVVKQLLSLDDFISAVDEEDCCHRAPWIAVDNHNLTTAATMTIIDIIFTIKPQLLMFLDGLGVVVLLETLAGGSS